ncbi:hypothetical protein C6501_06255 [Candidatus Poribacteria bacterium]|nr:MAG: hypothetical protein C6501_06255 [Candidatus Poribacteria bacterium]
MFKENSVDNWILGGTVFLLIFTLGCYLWFQNEMAYLQPQDTSVERQHLKKASETKQAEKPQIELTDTAQPEASQKNSSKPEESSVFTSNAINAQQENTENGDPNSISVIV